MQTKSIPGHILARLFSDQIKSRFWSRIRMGSKDECWPWLRGRTNMGYGEMNLYHATRLKPSFIMTAHRIAWMLHHDQLIPSGRFVLHSCNNPRCCNPDHLRLGDQAENMRQMVQQGRAANGRVCGESHGMSKLTNVEVLQIRALTASGLDEKHLAQRFGMSKTSIRNIVTRETWKHI